MRYPESSVIVSGAKLRTGVLVDGTSKNCNSPEVDAGMVHTTMDEPPVSAVFAVNEPQRVALGVVLKRGRSKLHKGQRQSAYLGKRYGVEDDHAHRIALSANEVAVSRGIQRTTKDNVERQREGRAADQSGYVLRIEFDYLQRKRQP